MHKPRLTPGYDLALAANLVDIDPVTFEESPLTGGSVTAFLATSPTGTAVDATLSVAATHIGDGEWGAHWDNSILTAPLLATHFADATPYAVFVHSGGVRTYIALDYQTTRYALDVVAELKVALRVRNTAEDDYIQSLYDAALATIERETGEWYGESKTVIETLRGVGDIAWLSSEPLALTTVEALDESNAWSIVDAADYERDGRRMKFLNAETYYVPPERRVTYTTGRAIENIPPDVWLRITHLVALWFEHRLPSTALFEAQAAVLGYPGSI